ncbi:MAG: heat-inducible transcriptional repressor HrcA, partial [Pyrinomonadaceae bacterium]
MRTSTLHSSQRASQRATTADAREQAVLFAIIEEHLLTGGPVGSRVVSERFAGAAGWSSATVRNLMAALEDSGLIDHPHTSAGRVPTDLGYRFYVDHVAIDNKLSKSDLSAIDRAFRLPEGRVATDDSIKLMGKVSHLLSEISDNIGLVMYPSLADTRLQHIEFVRISDERILVVIVSSPNIIQNKLVRATEPFTQDELERMAHYLNVEFTGKTLITIRAELLSKIKAERTLYDHVFKNAIRLCNLSLEDDGVSEGDIFVDGTSNILTKQEFIANIDTLRELLRTLEEKSRLFSLLNICINREPTDASVKVVIGREHKNSSMQNCTLIATSYSLGAGTIGTLGVVGPMRIEYARIIGIVNYVARLFEHALI